MARRTAPRKGASPGSVPYLAYFFFASCNARTRLGKICVYAGLTRFLKSIEQPREYIKFEGNRITVRLPATKTEYEEHVLAEGSRQQLEQFKKSGGQVNFKDDEIIASIGQPSDKQTTWTMSFSEKTYRTNLLQEVKKRGLIQEKLDPQAAARSFF